MPFWLKPQRFEPGFVCFDTELVGRVPLGGPGLPVRGGPGLFGILPRLFHPYPRSWEDLKLIRRVVLG